MSKRSLRMVTGLLTAALVLVVVVGLLQRSPGPKDRATALAARLRCPVCQSVSVADSSSPTAEAMRAAIRRMVAEGRSDQDIVGYFEARYGRWVLLDPPAAGATLPLWLLPGAALLFGVCLVIVYRHRPPARMPTADRAGPDLGQADPGGAGGGAVNPSRAVLEGRREQALRDLVELGRQAAAGEIDPSTAARLRAEYEAAAAEAVAALDARDQDPGDSGSVRPPSRRLIIGGVLAVVVLAALGFLLSRSIIDRPPGGLVSGIETAAGGTPPTVDDLQVSDDALQAVVDANPDVIPMRRVLAHRYFDEGKYNQALVQYTAVLERGDREPSTLSHAGWLVAVAGKAAAGAKLVEQSLATAPNDPEALWFLANIRLFGLGDAKGAIVPLERLRAQPSLPAETRNRVEQLLVDARRRAGEVPR